MRQLRSVLALTAAALLLHPATAARHWNQSPLPRPGATPQQQAMDYVHIMDMRSPTDLASTQWLPPLAMNVESGEKAMYADFVIVAVVHVTLKADGASVDLHDDEMPVLSDGDGNRLAPIADAVQPEALKTLLDHKRRLLQTKALPAEIADTPPFLRNLLEAYMRNLRFYAFRPGAIRECAKGRLTIAFAGRDYVFDTPLPGCTPLP